MVSFLLTVMAWGVLIATVANGVGRWSREPAGHSAAHVATADPDEQR